MRTFARVLVAAAALATFSAAFAADDLAPGSKAPSISVQKWVKGKEVKEFEAGKTYVVEFWATWCGPCIQSIPHLTEIAHKHKDVTFVGVSIWEDDSKVQAFVDKMGDKMDYNVAYGGNKEGMAESWMAAAGQNGIPTAFVVQDGRVRWIGHPMELEKPLDEVLAGTFNDAEFKAKFEKAAEANRKQMAAYKAIKEADKLHADGKIAEAKASLDQAQKQYGLGDEELSGTRLKWLASDDKGAFRKKIAESLKSNDVDARRKVCMTAMDLMDTKSDDVKALAKEAMASALKANKDDFISHYYGSMFYFNMKDGKAGGPVVDRALELIEKTEFSKNEDLKKTLQNWKKGLADMAKG